MNARTCSIIGYDYGVIRYVCAIIICLIILLHMMLDIRLVRADDVPGTTLRHHGSYRAAGSGTISGQRAFCLHFARDGVIYISSSPSSIVIRDVIDVLPTVHMHRAILLDRGWPNVHYSQGEIIHVSPHPREFSNIFNIITSLNLNP